MNFDRAKSHRYAVDRAKLENYMLRAKRETVDYTNLVENTAVSVREEEKKDREMEKKELLRNIPLRVLALRRFAWLQSYIKDLNKRYTKTKIRDIYGNHLTTKVQKYYKHIMSIS